MNNKKQRQDVEKEYFDILAEKNGETWWGHMTYAGRKRLKRRAGMIRQYLEKINGSRVLEIGCGAGALSKCILKAMPDIKLTCCDISPKMIDIAKHRCGSYGRASFEIADITRLPYPAERFDAVVGNSVLHHLPISASLKELMRVLRPGGGILFFEPNMLNPEVAVQKNIRFIGRLTQNTPNETAFFRWGMRKTLYNAGFRNIAVKPFDFLHPLTPKSFTPFIEKAGYMLEKVPILREISGSLVISAYKF